MNGIILIDKPRDWTSHDVVGKLRRLLKERRIGHSGTLDPMATGLLVVFVGRATRAVEFAEGDAKQYIAGLRLGLETDTQDTTGTVLQTYENHVTEEQLRAALPVFTGPISQVPPMYSALKVNGQKLYDIARKGGEVERKAREIIIHKLDLIDNSHLEEGDYCLDVTCSKGTYIRTLCYDIGRHLGVGGTMSSLRRVRAGGFHLADAYTIEQVAAAAEEGRAEELLLPVDSLFAEHEKLTLTDKQTKRTLVGGQFSVSVPDGTYRFYAPDGAFLALGKVEQGTASTIKSFFEV